MPVLIFFGVLLLIFMIGILPVVNLVLLSSCKSRIEDLLLRIRELEKAVEKGQPASPSKPGVKIQVPGTAETKTVPGFLLSNQPAANPPQKPAEIKPEVKPETPAPSVVKPEVKPMPVHVEPPAQAPSPIKPEPPKQVQPEIKPAAAAANTSETFDTKSLLNVPKESSAWMAGTKPAGASHFAPQGSAIEERTAEVLSKLWQWIIVGEEYRKGNMPKEYAIATTWMLRAAMLLLIFGLAYFIKYTHDRNLLPPELRLSIAGLFTLALLGIGCRLLKGVKYRIFGTALAGAGFAGL